MWTREQLKQRGKAAFLRNYWLCVVAALILTLLVGNGANGASGRSNANNDAHHSSITISTDSYGFDVGSFVEGFTPVGSVKFLFSVFSGFVMLAVAILLLLLKIFILNPFEVGGARFFTENAIEKTSLNHMLSGFQNGCYGKTVWTLFLRSLYIFLWSLLLIIPGIVKAYEYRMVPYLLADCPELSTEDVFRISREMMDGQKMNTFILDLSFIGWHILSSITCGIVGLFYSNPYIYATDAELFLALKQNYFSSQNYSNTYYSL